jgi:hypothetical protein
MLRERSRNFSELETMKSIAEDEDAISHGY